MYFLIEDDDLLDKYNTIWDNVSTDIKKEFDSELVCKKRFLKTKIKSHCDEFRDFYSKEIFILDSNHLFSSYQLRFRSQERWQLLSESLFKRL